MLRPEVDPIDHVALVLFDERGPCTQAFVDEYRMAIVDGSPGFYIPNQTLFMQRNGSPSMYGVAARGRSGQVIGYAAKSFEQVHLRRGDSITVQNISLCFMQYDCPIGFDLDAILGQRALPVAISTSSSGSAAAVDEVEIGVGDTR